METLNGKEILTCVRCTLPKEEVRTYTVHKETGDVSRNLCDDCRVNTEVTFKVTKAGRKSSDAEVVQEDPKEPVSTESTKEKRIAGDPPQRRSK